MSAEARWGMVPPPTVEPLEEHWKHFDDSMNALSFGFVATAILISMFLLLAIFEKFLRQRPTGESSAHDPVDLEGQMGFGRKLENLPPKMTMYGKGVLVLMPGEQIPTFIALPAPVPCPSEPISWPIQHNRCFPPPLASMRGII